MSSLSVTTILNQPQKLVTSLSQWVCLLESETQHTVHYYRLRTEFVKFNNLRHKSEKVYRSYISLYSSTVTQTHILLHIELGLHLFQNFQNHRHDILESSDCECGSELVVAIGIPRITHAVVFDSIFLLYYQVHEFENGNTLVMK